MTPLLDATPAITPDDSDPTPVTDSSPIDTAEASNTGTAGVAIADTDSDLSSLASFLSNFGANLKNLVGTTSQHKALVLAAVDAFIATL